MEKQLRPVRILPDFTQMAAGSVLGLAMGAGLMMMPKGRKMKRMLDKGSAQLKRQMKEMWER